MTGVTLVPTGVVDETHGERTVGVQDRDSRWVHWMHTRARAQGVVITVMKANSSLRCTLGPGTLVQVMRATEGA